MAETAAPLEQQSRPSFLKLLQSVDVLDSIRTESGNLPTLRDTVFGPMPKITIQCWSQADGAFQEREWKPMDDDGSGPYPFYTLDDLKLAIYKSQRMDPKWIPTQVFVGTGVGDDTNEFLPLDTLWFESGEQKILPSPLMVCSRDKRALSDFVESTGQAKLVERQDRGRMTLEDAYLIPRSGEMPTFYAFCASDMLRRFGIPEGQPVPAYDWNGRFRPYFPALLPDAYGPSGIEQVNIRVDYKRGVRGLLRGISVGLDQPLVQMEVSGIYALRLMLNTEPIVESTPNNESADQEKDFTNCEEFFFRTSVNGNRPFMRLLPSEGTPITKINVVGITPIPDIKDPNLIVQWAQEINPYDDEDQDYLFIKLYIRNPLRESVFPLYATARLFYDGTADLVLLPSKQQRILNPKIDLADLNLRISKCLANTYLENLPPIIDEVSLELALNLGRDDVPLTRARILERLRIFSYFFQETPNFDKDNVPLIMLKYKAVSQFATESRIFAFISQYFLKVQRGEAKISDQLVKTISEEFQITLDEAQDNARRFSLERDSFIVMSPDIHTFSEENASGIDIAIYGKHPTYQIRIYRCKTEMSLRRIYMLLSLLLSREAEIPVDNLSPDEVAEEAASAEEAAASAEEQEEENEESLIASSPNSSSSATPPQSVAAPILPKKTALMSAMFNDSGSESEEEPVAPPPRPTKSALMAAMYNSEEEEEEEEESPSPQPAPKKTALIVDSESEDETSAATKAIATKPSTVPAPPPALTIKRQTVAAAPPVLNSAVEEGEGWSQRLFGYFAKQLAKIDPALFVFKPITGDSYTRKCQASNNQQPVVLTPVEYNRMKEEYKDDTDKVRFIDFPLVDDKQAPVPLDDNIEIITIMRFGSDPNNLNYYLCPKYFCHLDRIVLLKADFENPGKWRNPDKTGEKQANRCPFCGGSKITDQISTRPGQTVSERKNKPKTNEIQDYIDFVKTTTHPKKLELPCCYISPSRAQFMEKSKKLHINNPAFAHMRAIAPDEVKETVTDEVIEQYSSALSKFPQKYILGENHHPLGLSKFGLVPACLDKYFEQGSELLVSRTAIKQIMRPDSKGFFRMGVNMSGSKRDIAEGLFNVLAPYLQVNTADEVRNRFLNILGDNTPEGKNRFVSINHGNLVNDFYKPSLAPTMPTDKELDDFSRNLATKYNSAISKPEMLRLFLAYNEFVEYLKDPTQTKEYRIFAPILAYPGMITERGLVVILLEYDSKNTSAPVRVRCPPFGYQPNIYDTADFAFVLRDQNGIYEALTFIDHASAPDLERGRHRSYLTFQVAQLPEFELKFPSILRRREEFVGRCKAPMYNIYTSQSGIPNSSILSYSQVISAEFQGGTRGLAVPRATVRDSYNHIAGCTFTYKYQNKDYEIPFPIADHDGFIPFQSQFYFDWSAIPLESLPTVPALVKFYTDVLASVAACQGYEPVESKYYRGILKDGTEVDKIVAVKLRNGLLIPVSDTSKTTILPIDSTTTEFEPEWELNRCIMFNDCRKERKPEVEEVPTLDKDRLDELYQHFRLSVANWLNSDEVEGGYIKYLEKEIIFNHKLPLYERRKRLEFVFRELYGWFAQDDEFSLEEPAFYRKDCRKILNPGSCNGACKWKEMGAASRGKCAIHIPTEYEMGDETRVDTATVFVRRVVDELLLFPEKRKQIIEQRVKKTGIFKTAIEVKGEDKGSKQYIIPDTSPRWQELLSLLWSTSTRDDIQAMEEISGDAPPEEETGACAIPRSVQAPRPKVRLLRTVAQRQNDAQEVVAPPQPLGPIVPPAAMKIRRVMQKAPVEQKPPAVPMPAATIRRAKTVAAPTIKRAATVAAPVVEE